MGNLPTIKTFEFHGDHLATFEHDGQHYVAMRPVVEALGMSWGSQSDKLRGNRGKFNCTDIGTVASDGRERSMLSMPIRKLPLWLASINPNKIHDEHRKAKIVLYQEESAVALHDYWTKGVAIKGDYDGLITDLDPKVMQALGGMFKGILVKALTETVPALVQSELADREIGIVRGVTALDVACMAGIENRRGLRGLGNFISNRLRRFHAEKGIALKVRDYGSMVSVYVYDKATAKDWLLNGGKETIQRYVQERRGQSALRLVGS